MPKPSTRPCRAADGIAAVFYSDLARATQQMARLTEEPDLPRAERVAVIRV